MGSDGGLIAVKLRDPSKWDRLNVLLAPLWSLIHERGSRLADDAHYGWLMAHSDVCEPEWLIGTYGTDRTKWDLDVLLDTIRDDHPDPEEQLDLTLEELWLDIQTRPDWLCGPWGMTPLESMLAESFEVFSERGIAELLRDIGKMKLCDWLAEIGSILDMSSREIHQTWT